MIDFAPQTLLLWLLLIAFLSDRYPVVKLPHRSGNVFLDLGFPPKEAKRLLAHTDVQIDESIRLQQQLMDQIAE